MMRALLIGCWLLAGVPSVKAATRRVAVVVGSNAGKSDQKPLRFAETDAGKIARLLVELGGVEQPDLLLLQGRGSADLEKALASAQTKIELWRREPTDRVMLLFYFSGHSDGVALELGRDRFLFSDLRDRLRKAQADVNVAIVDSCRSGGLLASKGGVPGPAFEIRLTDNLSSTGEVMLTSSAANEVALESQEIGGSFFTHHLLSGLRGGADLSGDGRVTLYEIYQYAYSRTITDTAATVVGAQHPAFDYSLAGQGELVLAETTPSTAILELPELDRALIVDVARDQVVGEVTGTSSHRIALAAGEYGITLWSGKRTASGRVSLASGSHLQLEWSSLSDLSAKKGARKGEEEQVVRKTNTPFSVTFMVAGGLARGAARDPGLVGSGRVAAHFGDATGLWLAVDASYGKGQHFQESAASFWAGYRVGAQVSRVTASAGMALGAGGVAQNLTGSGGGWSGTVAAAPWLGLELRLTEVVSLVAEGQFSVTLMRQDGRLAVTWLPAGFVGLGVRFP
ncbi:MAG: hypothetical protein A2289_03550 [Deltaproteobacteria bacterium RIFOXYA12_FULL_58_15]|nr:MAG: hypothetical protein A2289_03550 [Deltaproteobacteria bacterium RIFOXYA12_FULL_58_15]OGR13317.1 MAG: hypothetical protein A2341_02325 [Deltaproteobacteria bacterium RIFOXYB12_FULL_58_9]